LKLSILNVTYKFITGTSHKIWKYVTNRYIHIIKHGSQNHPKQGLLYGSILLNVINNIANIWSTFT